jgi:mono/diheme cytochrome c family protein
MNKYESLLCGVVAVFGLVAVGSSTVDVRAAAGRPAQSAQSKTVWDGVYTDQQSTRGRLVAESTCVSCHGEQLTGTDVAPALQGQDFRATWSGRAVGDLFEKIRTTMPADSVGTITPRQSVDLVAYILKLNEFPAGEGELAAEAAQLKEIGIRSQK